MDAVVVDTNVILVAKDMAAQASPACVQTCIERLARIVEGPERVVIDDNWEILGEYSDYEEDGSTTAARTGWGFLEWLMRNHENQEQCVKVHITPSVDGTGFEEFPTDPALSGFDPADKKFIAVAVVYENEHRQKVPILQAVDSNWYGLREAFARNGLTIDFICEANIRLLYERRSERRARN